MDKNPEEILEKYYEIAFDEFKKDKGQSFLNSLDKRQRDWLFIISDKAESFKAVITVLTTSLVKKVENPKQDVRYHRGSLKGGYSGRTYDTKFITPFFKSHFPRFAMKESGWLTRSIEQPHPFNLRFPGKIRDIEVKEAFLKILQDIEENRANPENYLLGLFILILREISVSDDLLKSRSFPQQKTLGIDLIIERLKEHFFTKYENAGASRLPVLAIYSIYEILLNDVARYKGKKLIPLKSHIASDIKAKEIGDIEIIDKWEGSIFEGIEIKHGIPIDFFTIYDVFEKIKNIPVERLYVLTTAEPNIKKGEEDKVIQLINDIKQDHGCEIVVNGLVQSIKYYLRLIKDLKEFIERYTENIKTEVSVSTVIKVEHVEKWNEIMKKS